MVVSPLAGHSATCLRFEVDLLGSLLLEADEDFAHHRGTTLRGLADRLGASLGKPWVEPVQIWDLGTWGLGVRVGLADLGFGGDF